MNLGNNLFTKSLLSRMKIAETRYLNFKSLPNILISIVISYLLLYTIAFLLTINKITL